LLGLFVPNVLLDQLVHCHLVDLSLHRLATIILVRLFRGVGHKSSRFGLHHTRLRILRVAFILLKMILVGLVFNDDGLQLRLLVPQSLQLLSVCGP
jgi:hypothetical protein